jgi:hypothetical protein
MVYDARYADGPGGTIRGVAPPPSAEQLKARAYDRAARLDIPLANFEDIAKAGALLEILGKQLQAIGRLRQMPEMEAIGNARREVFEAKCSLVDNHNLKRR